MFNKKWKERIKKLEKKVETLEVEIFRMKAEGKKYLAKVKLEFNTFIWHPVLSVSAVIDNKVETRDSVLPYRFAVVKSICGDIVTILTREDRETNYLINEDLSITELPDELQIKPEIPTYNYISPRRKKAKKEPVVTPEPKKRGGRPSSTGQRFISKCKNGFKIQKDGKYLGFQKTLEDAIKLRDYLLQEHE